MTKVATVHVEVKPVLNEQAAAEIHEALGGLVDDALCVTSASLIVSAVRMHEALYRQDEAMLTALPDDVLVAYGDLQAALRRLGLSV